MKTRLQELAGIKKANLLVERVNDDYAHEVQTLIKQKLKGKRLAGYAFDVESPAGSHTFEKGDIIVHATAFWEGNEDIPVEVKNFETDEDILDGNLRIKSTGDAAKDAQNAIAKIKTFLSRLKV